MWICHIYEQIYSRMGIMQAVVIAHFCVFFIILRLWIVDSCFEFIPENTFYVLGGMLNPAHSLLLSWIHWLTFLDMVRMIRISWTWNMFAIVMLLPPPLVTVVITVWLMKYTFIKLCLIINVLDILKCNCTGNGFHELSCTRFPTWSCCPASIKDWTQCIMSVSIDIIF